MNIKLVKLLNGEEIIGEVQDSTNTINIKNPLRIVIMPSMSEQVPKIGFSPWAPFSKDTEFSIDKSNIITIMNPIDEFLSQYKQSFSQIVTPTQSKLILPIK
jgi:hypothetical protein